MQQAESSELGKSDISIEEVIAQVVFAQDKQQLNILYKLNTLTQDKLVSYTADGLDPLTVVNPSQHSLVYLYFITARCQEATAENALQLYQLLNHFVETFDQEQVYFSPTRFTTIGRALENLAKVLKKPLLPLQTLSVAIQRFAETPNTFTSLHTSFVKACILAKAYTFPLEILSRDIELINTQKHDVNIRRLLEYYYYGSIIYIGNKNFDRALDFLITVISAPAQKTISAIQIAAYKKIILVSLIYQGTVKVLPKYTAQGVEKVSKSQSMPYLSLLKAFDETDLKLFNDTATKSSNIFEQDSHIGLVRQCYQALRRKKIKELTNVYIKIGMNQMANKIGDISPQELELVLTEMIVQNQISAEISITKEGEKMVNFNDEAEPIGVDLESRIFDIISINDKVASMDKLEELNKDFQTKYMTLAANGGHATSTTFEEDFDVQLDEDTKIFG